MGGGIEQQREVLRQARVALRDRAVTLWEIATTGNLAPLATTASSLPDDDARRELDTDLRRWGAALIPGSHWVSCRLDEAARWCVAPVRSQPALPPPGGVERRSPERLILELAGLCVGTIDAGSIRRLPPQVAAWEHARQPAVIAHEVGNQLTVAGGNLEFGIAAVRAAQSLDTGLRAQLLEDLTNAAKSIEQATDYLRAIQERSGPGTGRAERFEVTALARSCVTLERPLALKHGVALSWESTVESAYLFGESNALYRALTNLVRNAVDASRTHRGSVLVTLERSGDRLHLAVHDRGVGIARDDLERIFAAGFTTKPPGSGSGMGLAIVREIVEHMFAGTVRVQSEAGKGSTFTLVLPIPPQRRSA
ncbi:MAG TPA: HAMP domain-containing sensor histidine kinase [Gemmatimonadales bacterium]|nr:HAMP domain-containing sensor histidine kinase [Gemmatimonadales bacterium]